MAKATTVGTEIVEREGVDPLDLDVKLYDVIDADALDVLTERAADSGQGELLIEFTFHRYPITADGDGVTVDGQVPEAGETSAERQ